MAQQEDRREARREGGGGDWHGPCLECHVTLIFSPTVQSGLETVSSVGVLQVNVFLSCQEPGSGSHYYPSPSFHTSIGQTLRRSNFRPVTCHLQEWWYWVEGGGWDDCHLTIILWGDLICSETWYHWPWSSWLFVWGCCGSGSMSCSGRLWWRRVRSWWTVITQSSLSTQ